MCVEFGLNGNYGMLQSSVCRLSQAWHLISWSQPELRLLRRRTTPVALAPWPDSAARSSPSSPYCFLHSFAVQTYFDPNTEVIKLFNTLRLLHVLWHHCHYDGTVISLNMAAQYNTESTRSSAVAVIADRTACSILTLFIVSTTSRPLNKKSVCCQTANRINKFAVRTPLHVHCSRQSRHTPRSRRSHRTALCRTGSPRNPVSSMFIEL